MWTAYEKVDPEDSPRGVLIHVGLATVDVSYGSLRATDEVVPGAQTRVFA